MQQPIRANFSRDLGMRFFHLISSQDIPLAIDDGSCECHPHQVSYAKLDWLPFSEISGYHRQLFLWRLRPLLWALSRTTTPKNLTVRKHPSKTDN